MEVVNETTVLPRDDEILFVLCTVSMKPCPLFEAPPFENLAEVPTHRNNATMARLERRPRLASCLHRLCCLAFDADQAILEVDVFPSE